MKKPCPWIAKSDGFELTWIVPCVKSRHRKLSLIRQNILDIAQAHDLRADLQLGDAVGHAHLLHDSGRWIAVVIDAVDFLAEQARGIRERLAECNPVERRRQFIA